MKNTKLFKRFLPYYKKYTGILIIDLFAAALTTVCELVLPMIVREITDRATSSTVTLTVSFVVKVGVFYLVLRIIDTLANYYMATIGHVMGTKMETDMRRDMFSHLQKLSFSFYDETKIGSIMSRITSDLFDVTEFAHHCPEEIFIAFIKIAAAFVILCTVNIPLTLIVFAMVPPMVAVLMHFNSKMKEGFRLSRKTVAELNSSVEDSLLGIRVVKSFANESIEEEKFAKGNMGFLDIKTKVYKYMGTFHSCTRFFDGLMYITVVVAGAIFIINGKINAADLVAYLLFVTTLLSSIRRIVEFAEQFQRGMTGIERFAEIMDTNPDIKDSKGAKPLKNVKGEIEFKNVTFKYSPETRTILDNLSFKINVGENVALVGPSGGGKTTICSLIPRFYEINSGEITVDGKNVKDVTLRSLRDNIGIVQQDVYLFSGSVAENISYGRPGADFDDVVEAAKLAGIHEFIMTLPNGYDTYVGERGVKLSGGQKQRISIARVFLKNPPILILDEATSSLDNESEKLVQESLEKLSKGRTTLTIAHRLTTVRNADNIIVLTRDGIAETGTHESLMKKGGIYSDLYSLYI
ncbi:MAG: ABC transporter ATP-binding protein/permease [Clostridia bacterium]|nr:ABC transporter ATP-binding protein/permease [Clostridia bacterium]